MWLIFFLTFMSTHIKYITIRKIGLEICFVQMPYWKLSLNIANYIYIFQSLAETYIAYMFSECCKFFNKRISSLFFKCFTTFNSFDFFCYFLIHDIWFTIFRKKKKIVIFWSILEQNCYRKKLRLNCWVEKLLLLSTIYLWNDSKVSFLNFFYL